MTLPDFEQMTIKEIGNYLGCDPNKIRGRMSSGGGKVKRTKTEAAHNYLGMTEDSKTVGINVDIACRFHSFQLVRPQFWVDVF